MYNNLIFSHLPIGCHIAGQVHIVGGSAQIPIYIDVCKGIDSYKVKVLIGICDRHDRIIPDVNIFQALGVQGVGRKV